MTDRAEPTVTEWEERMHGELSRIVQDGQGDMLTRFVLITEAIDEDGGRRVSFLGSPDILPYDVAGMLHYATRSNNLAIDDSLREDEDDGDL